MDQARSCRPPAFKIKSYLLAHVYNRNLNDKGRNTSYLSLLCLSRRMILQPALKVSVFDASIYSSSTSIGPSLTWQEPQSQTVPPSVQVRTDLIPEKVSLYFNEEILSSCHSSKGPSPCNRPTPWGSPTRNSTGLRRDAGCLD